MIIFRGEISEECKQYLLKRFKRIWALTFLIIMLIIELLLTIALIITKEWLITLIMAFFFLFNILATFDRKSAKMNVADKMAKKITIKGGLLEREGNGERSYAVKKMYDVKKVVDMGAWYRIVYHFPFHDVYFICQKDLLVEGSIEEFEKLFEGKIVRK